MPEPSETPLHPARAGGSRDVHVVRPEPPSNRLDGVVHGNLDSRVVEEADRAAMGGTGVYDRLHSDRIPISYGVGSYD